MSPRAGVAPSLVALLVSCASPPAALPARTAPPPSTEPAYPLRDPDDPPTATEAIREPVRPGAAGAPPVLAPETPARRGRRIDLDVRDADIADVCRLLADVGKVNLVVADDVQGKVTVRMKQVPWDEALDVLARTKGLAVTREADVIVVRRPAP